MRAGLAGTPAFARDALAALLDAGFDVPLVLTQPDRPAGRGLKLQASPVKLLAAERGIAVVQPRGLRRDGRFADDAAQAASALAAADLDVLVVVAYGLILPPWVLALPRRGCINIHASLLPRWRGAAPIQRAIEAGDAETGITIMQMDAGLDTGPMLLAQALPIPPDATAAALHDALATLGARLVVDALSRLDRLVPRPQPADGASYAAKIDKSEGAIDWAQPAAAIERRVRAFDPFPGCSFRFAGETVKLWRAGPARPGSVLVMRCGDGHDLALLELQRTGGRRAPVADVLRGWPTGAQAAAAAGR